MLSTDLNILCANTATYIEEVDRYICRQVGLNPSEFLWREWEIYNDSEFATCGIQFL